MGRMPVMTAPGAADLMELSADAGVPLTPDAAGRLLEVLDRLDAATINLTTIHGRAEGVRRHLLDSLVALNLDVVRAARRIIDVGSGGGFPGVALAAALPSAEVTLVESVGRKAAWLDGLRDLFPNLRIAAERSETLAAHADPADLVTARALADPPVALELCAPLARTGGHVLLWAGAEKPDEERRIALAARTLGLSACRVVPVQPFPTADRRLLLFGKSNPTPARFPRRPGRARSHPVA